jgi:AcrR family transcriptional regulator
MALQAEDSQTRRQILRAALRRFAHGGYAATSVQQIVSDAKVSKPALYYYFTDKAGLFQALVHEAHDDRYRLLREAAAQRRDIRGQLVGILTALVEYFQRNRELMRISFATMFAAPGEVPTALCQGERCERNFEFVHALIQHAQAAGELDPRFDAREIAFGFYGLCNFFLMAHLVMPGSKPDKKTAERVVDLFLSGAAAKAKTRSRPRGAKQRSSQ